MNIYPSSKVPKRFEEIKPDRIWEEVPGDIRTDLFEAVQSAIHKRREDLRSLNATVSTLVISTLAFRFLPDSIPVIPTIGDQATIYTIGGVAVLGILNRADIIKKEEIQVSRKYNGLLFKRNTGGAGED